MNVYVPDVEGVNDGSIARISEELLVADEPDCEVGVEDAVDVVLEGHVMVTLP